MNLGRNIENYRTNNLKVKAITSGYTRYCSSFTETHGKREINLCAPVDSGKSFVHEVDTVEVLYNSNYRRTCCDEYFCNQDGDLEELISMLNINGLDALIDKADKSIKDNVSYALDIYNSSLQLNFKNDDSMPFGIIHAKRAIALKQLKFFNEAYTDCEIAKNYFYPHSKLESLLHLQATVSIELKCADKLRNIISELELFNEKSIQKCDAKKLNNYKEKLKELSNENAESSTNSTNIEIEKQISIKSTKYKGRFTEAQENISKNELIFKEKAFAFIPANMPGQATYPRCENCAKVNIIPYYCLECRKASYCSHACIKNHFSIHEFECKGYKTGFLQSCGAMHLSIRMLLTGFESLKNILIKENINDTDPKQMFDKVLKISETNTEIEYCKILLLATNFEKMSSKQLMEYAKPAVILSVYLKTQTEFFENLPNELYRRMSKLDWEIFISALLMRHIAQVNCNNQGITDLCYVLDKFSQIKLYEMHTILKIANVFNAVFPKASMLNHSCDPNIVNRYNGRELSVVANRDISKGNEIYNCYGAHYKINPNPANELKELYYFKCRCPKCTTAPAQESDYYICSKRSCKKKIYMNTSLVAINLDALLKKIKCPSCSTRLDLKWQHKLTTVCMNINANTPQTFMLHYSGTRKEKNPFRKQAI